MLHVIYDGQCGFCVRSIRVAQALDVRRRLRVHDASRRREALATFPELSDADFGNAMFVVSAARRVYRGFFAFRRMIWESPLTWLLVPLFYFPGAAVVGPKMYAWVARHRRWLSCESNVCELPQK